MGQVSSAELSTEANRVTAAREAIAYHEAGHAVISMKLGYKCLYVTIVPDGDRLDYDTSVAKTLWLEATTTRSNTH